MNEEEKVIYWEELMQEIANKWKMLVMVRMDEETVLYKPEGEEDD
ncbi:hypothetical protein [Archaeoglobus sp.]|nr:hypothetical protein [Archaeoglobus sp.]